MVPFKHNMQTVVKMTLVVSSLVLSHQAHAINIGKILGLQSSGAIAQVGEVFGYATGNPGLAAGSVTADRVNGQLNQFIPGKRAAENRFTNQFRQDVGLSPFMGNYCNTPYGRFGPGPSNSVGSRCKAIRGNNVYHGHVAK